MFLLCWYCRTLTRTTIVSFVPLTLGLFFFTFLLCINLYLFELKFSVNSCVLCISLLLHLGIFEPWYFCTSSVLLTLSWPRVVIAQLLSPSQPIQPGGLFMICFRNPMPATLRGRFMIWHGIFKVTIFIVIAIIIIIIARLSGCIGVRLSRSIANQGWIPTLHLLLQRG